MPKLRVAAPVAVPNHIRALNTAVLSASIKLGKCGNVDPELFFPPTGTNNRAEEAASARRMCSGCPVQAECLEFALRTRSLFGYFGGTADWERRVMLERRAKLEARQAQRDDDRAGQLAGVA